MSVLLLIFRGSLSEEIYIWLITNSTSPSIPVLEDVEVNPAGVFSFKGSVGFLQSDCTLAKSWGLASFCCSLLFLDY
jgi:hypothetical protein